MHSDQVAEDFVLAPARDSSGKPAKGWNVSGADL